METLAKKGVCREGWWWCGREGNAEVGSVGGVGGEGGCVCVKVYCSMIFWC